MKTLHIVLILLCIVSVEARLNVNVALNRPSYQVSTYYSSVTNNTYYARYANDGNHNTSLITGPCAHTWNETNPWWAVDLGVALYVHDVKFTNRGDCDPGSGTYVQYAFSDSSAPTHS